MATATALLTDACESGIACLTDRDLLVVLAQAVAASSGMTATELLQAACESGIACLQNRDLLVVSAQAINDGGGGAGLLEVYTGGAPPAAPDDPNAGAIFYPSSGGTLLQWDVGTASWV